MGTTLNAPPEEGLDQPSIDERRALIDRVAASSQFKRSARLRDFLLYVGNQSLKTGCPEIHEQEIGAKVFGRSSSYDRSQDNIVRVNATELRKRIGALRARIAASLAHVESLYVLEAHRRRGVGRGLLARIEELANYYNCHKVSVGVKSESGAQRFLEACGYHLEAVLPQHTFKLDVAMMRKFLL